MNRLLRGMAICGAAAAISGCNGKARSPAPLMPQASYAGQTAARPNAAPPSGSTDPQPVSANASPSASGPLAAIPASALPSTRPTTSPAGYTSSGTYMIVGAVVAEANGQPIYAEKVLAKLDQVLSTRASAPDMTRQGFRGFAGDLIRRQVDEEIWGELEFAAAQRNNTPEDEMIAAAVTTQWRQREIIKAGGSLAVARMNSLNPKDGAPIDFDEKVKEQYRRHMIQLYYQKRVWPRVQVRADDMRWYYDRNIAQFTENAGVKFRVIKVEVIRDRDAAMKRIEPLYRRAKSGEDFASLAAGSNDDKQIGRNQGFMDVVEMRKEDGSVMTDPDGRPVKDGIYYQKGSLKAVKLEEAVFALEPGQISEIIDAGDAFYVAKLEDRRVGGTKPFEDKAVQHAIREKLATEQRAALRLKEQQKLVASSIARTDRAMVEATIEMAMQKYGPSLRQATGP